MTCLLGSPSRMTRRTGLPILGWLPPSGLRRVERISRGAECVQGERTNRKRGPRWIRFALAGAIVLGMSGEALAQRTPKDPDDPEPKAFPKRAKPDKRDPLVITSDEVTYDAITDTVVATGRVEITQKERITGGDRTLRADRVIYDRRQDVIRAEGSVVMIEPTGEVMYAPAAELTGDFKEAVAADLRMRLASDALLASNGVRRQDGNVSEFAKATYSPCRLCEQDPNRAPLWQVKARKVVHDQNEKELYFYDSTFEVFGVPVAWLPYFSHPDPTVKRKTGFLPPIAGHDGYTGFNLTVPYFWAIDGQRDLTVENRMTSKRGPVLAGQYRQWWDQARLRIDASITDDLLHDSGGKTDEVRGHIFGHFYQNVDDMWRFGFDLERTSDRYYLRQYDYGGGNFLTSNAWAEAFGRRSYARLDTFNFQELRPNVSQKQDPYLAPRFQFSWIGDPLNWQLGGRLVAEASSRTILRESGPESTRFTAQVGYALPSYITAGGHVFDFLATVRGDFFDVKDAVDPYDSTNMFSGVRARFYPQVSGTWRYPMARHGDGATYQFIEPIVGFVAGPSLGRQWQVDNEDSLEQVYDESNFFYPNRTAGRDIIDGGQRINYGLKAGWYDAFANGVVGFVGQSIRAQRNEYFTQESGLRDRLSDIITAVMVNPGGYWDVMGSARLDKDRPGDLQQVSFFSSVGPAWFRPWAQYLRINNDLQPNEAYGRRREIRAGFTSQIETNWRFIAWGAEDLINHKISAGAIDVQYEDECFLIGARVSRNLAITENDRSDTRFVMRLVLKQFRDTKF